MHNRDQRILFIRNNKQYSILSQLLHTKIKNILMDSRISYETSVAYFHTKLTIGLPSHVEFEK